MTTWTGCICQEAEGEKGGPKLSQDIGMQQRKNGSSKSGDSVDAFSSNPTSRFNEVTEEANDADGTGETSVVPVDDPISHVRRLR